MAGYLQRLRYDLSCRDYAAAFWRLVLPLVPAAFVVLAGWLVYVAVA